LRFCHTRLAFRCPDMQRLRNQPQDTPLRLKIMGPPLFPALAMAENKKRSLPSNACTEDLSPRSMCNHRSGSRIGNPWKSDDVNLVQKFQAPEMPNSEGHLHAFGHFDDAHINVGCVFFEIIRLFVPCTICVSSSSISLMTCAHVKIIFGVRIIPVPACRSPSSVFPVKWTITDEKTPVRKIGAESGCQPHVSGGFQLRASRKKQYFFQA